MIRAKVSRMGASRLGAPTVTTPTAWQPSVPPPPVRVAEAPVDSTPVAARGRVAVAVWLLRAVLLAAVMVYGVYVQRQVEPAALAVRWVSEPTVLALSLCAGVALEAAEQGERAAAARRAATVAVLLSAGGELSAVALFTCAALAASLRPEGWASAPWFLAAWAGPLAVCSIPAASARTAVAAACFAAQACAEAYQEDTVTRALWLMNDATLAWACCVGVLA